MSSTITGRDHFRRQNSPAGSEAVVVARRDPLVLHMNITNTHHGISSEQQEEAAAAKARGRRMLDIFPHSNFRNLSIFLSISEVVVRRDPLVLGQGMEFYDTSRT